MIYIGATIQTKGNHYYIVVDTYDENGKRKPKWIATGLEIKGNKRKAEEKRKEIEREYELKSKLVPSDITLDELAQKWLNEYKNEVDIITFGGYESIVKVHIIPYFEEHKIKVNEVTFETIQKYIDEKKVSGNKITGEGLSPKTLKSHMTVFKLIFNLARKKKIIYDDCLEFVKLPTLTHEKVNFYSAEEVQKVWEAIKDDRIFHLIYATIYFGMRRSEVLGLRWNAIDFENKMLIVRHTVVMYNNKVVAKDSTKTDASNRTYPLSDDMIEFFKWLKAREEEERAACGKDYIENDYIFKWPNGKLYDPDYISKHFKKLLKKNDLKRIRFHDLRHSCAALLLSEGRELYDVSEWLGHSDVNITAKFYGHLDMKRKKDLGNTIGNSIGFKNNV